MKNMTVISLAAAALAGCASAPQDAAPQKTASGCGCVAANGACACKAKVQYPRVEDTTGQRQWKMPFQLGLAGFTAHKMSLDDTLALMQAVDLHYLCVKDFHLKYTATDAEIAAFKAKCAKFGVTPYALGPLYTKTNEDVRRYFAFAKRFGAKVIVGVPYDAGDEKDSWSKRKGSRKQLEYIDKLVKEFDIRYAIHNHGPNAPEMFPDVAYGWNLVKDLDARIGFCIDIGWEFGCDRDPAATIRKYGDRIFDAHVKNFALNLPGAQKIGKNSFTTVPMPRGAIDYGEVFKALADVGYAGVCAFEYERDFTNNLEGLAESVGYARGVCDTLPVKAKMQPVPAGANALTAAEKADGWTLLFDGKDLPTDTFVGVKNGFKAFPAKGWFVKDGCLTMRPVNGIANGKWFPLPPEDQKLGGGGDIVTVKKYRDFAFKFDFRLTEAANSGVKYFYDEKQNRGTCEEYQVLDSAHPDSTKGKDGNRRVAALYDLLPAPGADALVKPLGQWNTGMVVAKGPKVEHWLNGVKVLEYDRTTSAFKDAVKASKYATWGQTADGQPQPWGEIAEGRLLLQDHSDSTVSFCNLKVKEL